MAKPKDSNVRENVPLYLKFRSLIKESPLMYRLLPSKVLWKPRSFSVGLTTSCNLKCIMCARQSNTFKKGCNMSTKTYLNLAKYFKGKDVDFMSLGETLLFPDLFKFIGIAKSRGARSIRLTTNGVFLTEDVSKKLIENQVTSIAVSIDGFGKGYERVRVGSNFNKVFENIKRLSELKKEYGSEKPYVFISFLTIKSNVRDLPKLLALLAPYIDTIGTLHPLNFSKDIADDHLLNGNVKLAEEVFKETMEEAKKLNVGVMLRPLSPIAGGCLEPWAKPYIAYDGTVYPCSIVGANHDIKVIKEYYEDAEWEVKLKDYAMGNINDEDFLRIWNNRKYRTLRKGLSKIFSKDVGKRMTEEAYVELIKKEGKFYCRICPYRFNCAA
jgi:MoaA/NifB/PqqE/SkfB family radical SAM enzyme